MSRFPHYLQSNKAVQQPSNVIFFDTETTQHEVGPGEVEHRLAFGWGCFTRKWAVDTWTEPEWFRFTSPREFWSWVESKTRKKTRLYLFAHNLLFDARVLSVFTSMLDGEWTLSRSIIEGPPTILVWKRDSRTIEMLDTLNWWRVPLATLGDRVGLPKLAFPAKSADTETWDTYCRRDVEVLRRTLFEWWGFLGEHDLGGFARTLAGQAFRSYRHRFMEVPIFIDTNEKSLASARGCYYGGRTECFRIGRIEEPVRVYDVNSMYPAVMAAGSFPTEHVSFIRHPTMREVEKWVKEYAVCALARVVTSRPVFPYRHEGKLVFPVGRFETYLSTPEIADAIENDELESVRDVAIYEQAPIFSGFVTELYQRRREATDRGDDVARYMLKILMNSLYGKFGQRGKVWARIGPAESTDTKRWREIDVETGHVYSWRQYGGVLECLSEEPEGIESHPAIAAHVTAAARLLLWRAIVKAGRDTVLYCDTDSLIVTKAGWSAFDGATSDTELGAWALECESAWFEVHGPKDYAMEGKTRTKGVKKSARWLDSSTVEQEQWDSMRAAIRSGTDRLPRTKTIVKHLKRVYTKGTVLPDGRVEPLRFAEW